MRGQPQFRDTWPVYLRYVALATAIVVSLAFVQFLFVYGTEQVAASLFVIPVTVGLIFGLMLARIRLLRSQASLLKTFVESTTGSGQAHSLPRLLRTISKVLDMQGAVLYEREAGAIGIRARWLAPATTEPGVSDATLQAWFDHAARDPRPFPCNPGDPGAERASMICREAVAVRLPPQREGLLVVYGRPLSRLRADVGQASFLQLCADWLAMNLTRMHQQDLIEHERERYWREKERAQTTLESIADGVITTDADGQVDYVNPVAARLLEQPAQALKGRPLEAVLRLEDENNGEPRPRLLQLLGGNDHRDSAQSDIVLRTASGQTRPVQITVSPVLNRPTSSRASVVAIRDVSELRAVMHNLEYQSTHDALTGLLNRPAFEEELELALQEARQGKARHTLCYLDLDQFKIINDTRGHGAGDELLRQIGARLQDLVRRQDTLARLGGDEFGILMHGCDIEQGEAVAEHIARELAGFRFFWDDSIFTVSASLGLVSVDTTSESTRLLLQRADTACYAAKDAGRNQVRVFTLEDRELRDRTGQLHWVSHIPAALEQDRFRLWAQPVQHMGDGEELYREVLLRLRAPDGQLVEPGRFIPAAERFDLMPQLDRWVVLHAVQYLQRQQARRQTLPVLGINLSGTSLNNDDFITFLPAVIADSGVPAGQFCFEITETAAVRRMLRTAQLMREMGALGCRFALDDFGSGLSSFAYLKHLPVDYLKIDGSFIHNIGTDPIDHGMVRAIHDISQILGLTTIAEQVESEAVRRQLLELGIDHGQGFGLARPVPLPGPTGSAE